MKKFLLILHDAQDATNKGRKELEGRLCLLFGADEEAVRLLLAELPVILERGLSQAQAEQLRSAFNAAGAEVEILEDFGPEEEDEATEINQSLEPISAAPNPTPAQPKTKSGKPEEFSPELSLEEALNDCDDDEFQVVGSEPLTEHGQAIEDEISMQLPTSSDISSGPEAVARIGSDLSIGDAEEISELSEKLDQLLQADDLDEVEETEDSIDLDSVDASIEDLKDMLDREIAADAGDFKSQNASMPKALEEPLESMALSLDEVQDQAPVQTQAEGSSDDLILAPEEGAGPATSTEKPALIPSLAMDESDGPEDLVGPPEEVSSTPEEVTVKTEVVAETLASEEVAPDGAFARSEDLDEEEDDEDWESAEEEEEDYDDDDYYDDQELEVHSTSEWSRERYLKVGAGVSLFFLCVGLTAFFLRPTPNGRMTVDLEDPMMISSLLREQKKILGPIKDTKEVDEVRFPLHIWTAKVPFQQATFHLTLRTRNSLVESFDIRSDSPKPDPLTPEQIVLGMRSPLWLKRFELDKAGNQLHTVAAKADSIEVFNVAPAYIEDGDLGTRVVVDVHVWADISYQPEPQITGKLRVIGGHNAEEIPKYSGLSRVDQAVYRIFFEKEFKATLQEVEQLADTENKPKSNMKLSKGDSKK